MVTIIYVTTDMAFTSEGSYTLTVLTGIALNSFTVVMETLLLRKSTVTPCLTGITLNPFALEKVVTPRWIFLL